MRYFRTEKNELVNLIDHTIEQITEYPSVKIIIGTDSQSGGRNTEFVTCVCFRWEENRGVHYVYIKDKVPRIKDTFMRLYEEGTRTIDIFNLFKDIPIKIEALEFDYAGVRKTISSQLVSTFKGWCEGLGQKSIFKGGEMIATKAADHKLRKS